MEHSARSSAMVTTGWRRIRDWGGRKRFWLGLLAVLGVFALSSIPNTLPPRVHGLDKVKHVIEYFCVGLVFLNVATRGFTRWRSGALIAAWLALVLLGLVDETYQRLIPGRSFDWKDWLASASGGTLAGATVLLGRWLRGLTLPSVPPQL